MNTYHKNDNLLTCVLQGKIDTMNCAVLENEINEQMNGDITAVTFDMGGVDYISSTFLRIVIRLVKALGKEKFIISNVQPSVMKVFKISNLAEIVTIN
jgi:anti-anti-sigma factor